MYILWTISKNGGNKPNSWSTSLPINFDIKSLNSELVLYPVFISAAIFIASFDNCVIFKCPSLANFILVPEFIK